MKTQCQSCSAKSQLWLCPRCQGDLKQLLDGLSLGTPLGNGRRSRPWLVSLYDEVHGNTRKGESARRSTDKTSPLPFREVASALALKAKGTLGTWLRHLCETRGIEHPNIHTTIGMAKWLSRHISAIANDEGCGELVADVQGLVGEIERIINRPVMDQFCGTCNGVVESMPCDMRLYAPREAAEVYCTRCKTTHNIAELFERTLNASDDKSFTIKELHKTILPAVRCHIEDPQRTMRRWFTTGKLVPTGYDSDGEPRFLLADVRELRDAKPQKSKTGAAAEKYKRRAG